MNAYEEWMKENPNCNSWECENTWRAALEWVLAVASSWRKCGIPTEVEEIIEKELEN